MFPSKLAVHSDTDELPPLFLGTSRESKQDSHPTMELYVYNRAGNPVPANQGQKKAAPPALTVTESFYFDGRFS